MIMNVALRPTIYLFSCTPANFSVSAKWKSLVQAYLRQARCCAAQQGTIDISSLSKRREPRALQSPSDMAYLTKVLIAATASRLPTRYVCVSHAYTVPGV
jgi:hypothetical protein